MKLRIFRYVSHIVLSTFILCLSLIAQQTSEMRVVEGSVKFLPEELVDKSLRDANGAVCAGFMILSDLEGLSFDSYNGVVKRNQKPGQDFLFLSPDERVVTVYKTGYSPLKIILNEYNIKLESGKTWRLKVTGERKLELISITIKSKPEGARITIDSVDKGSSRIQQVPPGKHILMLEKEGYRTYKQEIIVSPTNVYFETALQEIEMTSVKLKSKPDGATILINNVEKGKTPKGMFLYPGNYRVRVAFTGYIDIDTSVEVKEGEPAVYEFTLVKNAGALSVSFSPDDAEIRINDQVYTRGAFELKPGKYIVAVSKIGYVPQTETLLIKRGEIIERRYELEKNAGILTLAVSPVDAEVRINDQLYTNRIIELKPGEYTISVSKNGFISQRENVSLKRSEKIERKYALSKSTGTLSLTISPPDAEVRMNDQQYTGGDFELKPGEYAITVTKSGYISQTESVTILQGGTIQRSYTLLKNAGTLLLSVIPTDAKVFINKEDYSNKVGIDIPPGKCKIEIHKEGYYDTSETFEIALGIQYERVYVLRQKVGKLIFTITPLEAVVEMKRNEKIIYSWQGMNQLKNVPIGEYVLECKASGYIHLTKTITIAEEGTLNEEISLQALMPINGKGVETITPETPLQERVVFKDMVFVEGGWFEMGSNLGAKDEKPAHKVYLEDFYIDTYEITWSEYEKIMGNKPSKIRCPDCPVDNVSWRDAMDYAKKVGKRLLTEAEWEYAARGGKMSKGYIFSGGDSINLVGWFTGNSGERSHPVGGKLPNELGIYDMTGNAWEWCSDWYDENFYQKSADRNPQGPGMGTNRVLRGGSWNAKDRICRVTNRNYYNPLDRYGNIGFRCARSK